MGCFIYKCQIIGSARLFACGKGKPESLILGGSAIDFCVQRHQNRILLIGTASNLLRGFTHIKILVLFFRFFLLCFFNRFLRLFSAASGKCHHRHCQTQQNCPHTFFHGQPLLCCQNQNPFVLLCRSLYSRKIQKGTAVLIVSVYALSDFLQ